LPYLWGRTLVYALLVGRPDRVGVALAELTGLVILAVMLLPWNLRTPGRGAGTFLGWIVVNLILFSWYAQPQMPMWQLLAVFVPSTVWVVWLAWFGSWPLRPSARLGL